MQNKKTKKRTLRITIAIVVACILVVSGFSIYMRLDDNKHPSNAEQIGELNLAEEHGTSTSIIDSERYLIDSSAEGDIASGGLNDLSALDDLDDKEFEKEYAKFLASSLADVPARPLEEAGERTQLSPNLIKNDVPKSGLLNTIGNFFCTLIDRFCSIFETDRVEKEQVMSNDLLAEIDGEIGEMQSHFTLSKESNGVTYIDHLNKPMMLESNGLYIYIGVAPNGFTFHRTIIRYSGDEEIDLKNILIQTSSSDRASIIDASESVYQKKITTKANEWVDLPPTQENNSMLNSIVSSDQVKVTFMGTNRNVEWTLTGNEMVTLKESLYFYNLLKEREELSK